jgi:hypothetical protein
MARFMPGARISQAHGTMRPADPATGAPDALVFAMYHPAAALRTPAIERESYADIAGVPTALIASRERRAARAAAVATPPPAPAAAPRPDPVPVSEPLPESVPSPAPEPAPAVADLVTTQPAAAETDQLTLF